MTKTQGIIINGINGLLWKGNRLKTGNKALNLDSGKISLSNTTITESGKVKESGK